ncbi:TPC10 protein, partial [Atractosteus spatula]|nr:TPC10 protein [Atractosteus spatula]
LPQCLFRLALVLQVSVLQGSLDCWVFLSCLEVLQRIEGCCDRAQLEANISHTVGLWTYATEKLKSLGCLCGLVSENGPNSEDLNRTVDLLAGLGTERPETASSLQSPYKKLKEALSSVEAFEKHYLELSHAAMEMYKTIVWLRFFLTKFTLRKSDPKKAEAFFQDSLKTYLAEGWALPVTHTRKQIAECQKLLGQTESYLQTSSLLASDGNLSDEERKHFCQEILNFASQQSDNQVQKVVLGMSSFAQLQHLLFTPTSAVVHVGGQLALELSLHSNMPMPVHLEQLAVSVHFSIERSSIRDTGDVLGKQRTGGVNSGIIHFPGELPAGCLHRTSPPVLELYEMHDRSPSDNALNSSGVVCKNVHLLLRRRESVSSLETPSGVAVEDSAQILRTNDVLLLPGRNKILFTAPSREPGTYTLRQLSATLGQVHFVQPHIYPIVQYEVYSQEPQLKVEPLTDVLLAGVPQRVKFTIVTGHYSIKKGDALQLSNNDSMPILHSTDCTATIMSSTGERMGENGLSIQSSEKVTSITLPLTSTYHMVEFELEVMCHIPSILPKATDSDRLTNGELYRRAKSKCKTESHMASIDQKMSIDCPWSIYSTLVALTFYIPFKSQHSLLSAGMRKYIQVCMKNMSDMNFHLLNHCLTEKQKNTTLELVPVNVKPQQNVYSKQSVFCLWEVKWTTEPPSCLQCVFTISFSPMTEEEPSFQPYSYEFQLDNISTLYSVKAQIVPAPGVQHCRTGSLCSLNVSLTRLSDLIEQNSDEGLTESDVLCTTKVMYEVADNSSNWAVCGKSSGVISMPVTASATHKVQMEVMPLFAGNLPFPSIRVFKYLPHHAAHSMQPDTDSWIENDNLSIDKSLDEQGDNSSIRSRTSTHSIGNEHKGLPIPRLEPFSSGQVFNSSSGQQVLVMPSKDDHVLEVNIT